jgi:hypothetical protein
MYKSLIIITILFVSNVTAVFGQNEITDTSTTIVSYWKKGESQFLTIKRSKEKLENDTIVSSNSFEYEAQVTVIEEKPTSYTIEWTYHVDPSNAETTLSSSLLGICDGLRILYKTDELGTFKELINWEEIRDRLNASYELIAKEYRKKKGMEEVLENVKAIFQSKENIELILIRDIQLYHTPFGGMYVLNEKLKYHTEITNVFGGDPFPTELTLELTALDPKKDQCKLSMLQSLDQVKSSELIVEALENLGTDKSQQRNSRSKSFRLDIRDRNEFEVELSTGWLSKAFYQRTIEIENIVQKETIDITLQR